MYTASLPAQIREMDADELEAKASEILSEAKDRAMMNHEQIALTIIQSQYKQVTGTELVIESQPQLAS